jgi:hypothetical protein
MKHIGPKTLLILMVSAISLAGCGGTTEERDVPVTVDPTHQDDPQTPDQGVPEVVVRPEDEVVDLQPGPTGPVEAQWLGVDQPEVSGLETLQLRIRNVAPVSVTVTAEMVFEGFIHRTATRQLTTKPRDLEVGEDLHLTVAAKEFPIQNTTGASQFKASLRIQPKTAKGYAGREYLVTTAPVMYRHDASYNSITVFDLQTLIQKQGGIIAGNPNKPSDDKVVGRIIGASGKMQALTERDLLAKMIDEQGKVHGTIDALAVEIVVDGPDNAIHPINYKQFQTVKILDSDPVEKEGDNAL